jgi:hypothetical protein
VLSKVFVEESFHKVIRCAANCAQKRVQVSRALKVFENLLKLGCKTSLNKVAEEDVLV